MKKLLQKIVRWPFRPGNGLPHMTMKTMRRIVGFFALWACAITLIMGWGVARLENNQKTLEEVIALREANTCTRIWETTRNSRALVEESTVAGATVAIRSLLDVAQRSSDLIETDEQRRELQYQLEAAVTVHLTPQLERIAERHPDPECSEEAALAVVDESAQERDKITEILEPSLILAYIGVPAILLLVLVTFLKARSTDNAVNHRVHGTTISQDISDIKAELKSYHRDLIWLIHKQGDQDRRSQSDDDEPEDEPGEQQ